MRLLPLACCLVAAAAHAAAAPVRHDRCALADPRAGLGCSTDRNLRTMIANPPDLARGRPSSATPGMLDAAAIERLRTDRVKAFVGSGATDNFQPATAR